MFGKSQKVLDAERELKQILKQNPIVEEFINCLREIGTEDEYAWMHTICEYGDTRNRKVKVDNRYIKIFHPGNPDAPGIRIDCTKFGYKPMEKSTDSRFQYISMYDVIELWCEVLKERMREVYPRYVYTAAQKEASNAGEFSFQYILPEYPWKAWF